MIGMMVLFTITALIIALGIGVIVDTASHNSDAGEFAGMLSGIVLTIIAIVLVIQVSNVELEKNLAWFQETKATYNASIEDKNLTGFERVEITNTAIKANRELAKLKIDLDQWWNAPYKNSIVKQVEEQTMIRTEGER